MTFGLFLMFFSEMTGEAADIVHEAEPTEGLEAEIDMFVKNYENPY